MDNKIDASVSTINGTISSLSTRLDKKIDNEIARATEAENLLSSNLTASLSTINQTISTLCTNLTASITSSVSSLNTKIDAEAQRATAKENEIIGSLSLETQARIDGDNTLSTNLNKEIQDRKDAISSLSTSLTASINSSVSTLNSKLDEEISRATTREDELEESIATETSNRTSAISSLSVTLTNSINSINSTLSKAIEEEANRAKGVENILSSNIASVSTALNEFITETAPNTYIKGSNLTNQQILLGAGERNIAASGKRFEEEQLSSSQSYIPTSQAVHNYVDPLFNNKVDKLNTNNVVYATTSTGAQTSIQYSTVNGNDTIVQRKSDGTIEAGNPSGNFDVVNLNYARAELNKKVSTITVSGNAEFVYSKNTNGNNTGILTSSNDGSDDASSKVTKYSIGGSLLVNLSDNLSEENKQRQAVPKSYVDKIKTTIDNKISSLSTSLTSTINTHINNKENPHNVTKAQLGLGNVDNTSDLDKPISTATQSAISSINTIISTISSDIQGIKDNLEAVNGFVYEDLGEV